MPESLESMLADRKAPKDASEAASEKQPDLVPGDST